LQAGERLTSYWVVAISGKGNRRVIGMVSAVSNLIGKSKVA